MHVTETFLTNVIVDPSPWFRRGPKHEYAIQMRYHTVCRSFELEWLRHQPDNENPEGNKCYIHFLKMSNCETLALF
jgi:hypothetical protein